GVEDRFRSLRPSAPTLISRDRSPPRPPANPGLVDDFPGRASLPDRPERREKPMRSRNISGPGDPRGPCPRPNLTMRELIGLVLAFAVSNAFLSWIEHASGSMRGHVVASNPVAFGVWNGLLAFYMGFAFLQAWIRSVFRWWRTGDASPPDRR